MKEGKIEVKGAEKEEVKEGEIKVKEGKIEVKGAEKEEVKEGEIKEVNFCLR